MLKATHMQQDGPEVLSIYLCHVWGHMWRHAYAWYLCPLHEHAEQCHADEQVSWSLPAGSKYCNIGLSITAELHFPTALGLTHTNQHAAALREVGVSAAT